MNPFSNVDEQSIADWGEVRLIEKIRETLGDTCPPAPEGIGDDAAVLPAPDKHTHAVVTTDALVWNRHFDASATPELAGSKLAKRNLSDLAAMGAAPGWMTLNLLMGADVDKEWLLAFVGGIRNTCSTYGSTVVGGDIAQDKPGTFAGFITAGGTTLRPLLRTGAAIHDSLWVTGSLGGSIQGKHLYFHPRIDEGRWLANLPAVKSCIDLTDGLAKDLPALLPPGSAASLFTDKIPLNPDLQPSEQTPLYHAFHDGEDYELLFSVDAQLKPDQFHKLWRQDVPQTEVSHIGYVVATTGAGPFLDHTNQQPIPTEEAGGYQHLQS